MLFPKDFIDKIRTRSPISEVIGKRIPLKRNGHIFKGLCPFHKEKSPSFTVSDDKGFYHCFGCSAHGDAIKFVMDYENLPYKEAIELLAGEFGLPIPKNTPYNREAENKSQSLEKIVATAAEWFVAQLKSNQGNNEAYNYLKERGINQESIDKFAIGYAPNIKDGLKNFLLKQGIKESLIIEAGLLGKADDGNSYDRFRGRIIFPIRNLQGIIVAFGGRILPSLGSKNLAKYLNSPETPLYKKGELLFAYDIAIKSAREKNQIIVAEGYLDVIAMHQAGFSNSVAPLGTAITDSQLKLLWKNVSEPILCLDGDAAGKRAMMRTAEIALPLLNAGISLKFAILPKGEDPDSLIKKSGSNALGQIIAQSKILSQVLWESAVAGIGSDTPEKKSRLEKYLIELSEKINDAIVKQHIKNYFKEQIFALNYSKKKGGKPAAKKLVLPTLPEANDDSIHLKHLEENILSIVLNMPQILHLPDIEEYFAHLEFSQPMLDKLGCNILEICTVSQSIDREELVQKLDSCGYGEKVQDLLNLSNSASTLFNSEILANNELAKNSFAKRNFELAYFAYTKKKLECEKNTAEIALGIDMSEANLGRLTALETQINQLSDLIYAKISDENSF